jgi:AraC-like DNA-binding protein
MAMMKHQAAGKARGVLKADAKVGAFHHARLLPAADVARFVESYWIVRWDLTGHDPQTRETLPHPSVHLVLEPGKSGLAGVTTGKFTTTLAGRSQAFGVKFLAGGFRGFVNEPVSNFTDRVMPLRNVFGEGALQLEAAILAMEDDEAQVELAERFIRERLPERDESGEVAGRIVKRIADDRSILKVDDLLREFPIGKRSLQRLFHDYVGVTPKWVIQRYRLHEALAQLEEGTAVDWSKMAADLGYFDQAHFIKDFKALIGRTPLEYAREPSGRSPNPG